VLNAGFAEEVPAPINDPGFARRTGEDGGSARAVGDREASSANRSGVAFECHMTASPKPV
jgi:hypothetical protein